MSIKILHAADFHMDSPFYSLPQDKAAQRRSEQRQLLQRLAEAVEREQAQVVLLAGDLFDSSSSYWETSETLTRVLSEIKAHIFIAPGNHDYYTSRSPYAFMELPENVHIFKTPSIRCFELPELNCRVWGAGFSAVVCDPLLRGFSVGSSDMTEIMVMHGDLTGDRYNYISQEDIAASGLDYLALGHIHSFSGIMKAGSTFYAYPGCLEGRGFDELGPKGVIAGTVSKGECDLHFLPIPGRQYRIFEADLSSSDSAIEAALAAVGDGYPEDVARLILKGEFSGSIDNDAIAEALDGKFYHITVKNETRPRRGIWDGIGDDSLTGLFLSGLKARYDSAASDEERSRCLLAARYGIAALEERDEWRP
ncbi:MAG: exonuclease SbcCD subunit D [Oscillospiraceae bacterium]